MENKRLLLLTGLSGRIGGGIYILAGLLRLLGEFVPGLIIFSTLGLIIGRALTPFLLIGLYTYQIKEMGKLGLVGFIFSMLGIAMDLETGWLFLLAGLALMAVANGMSEKVNVYSVFLWLAGSFATLALSRVGWYAFIGLGLLFEGIGRYWLGTDLNNRVSLDLKND